jgi:transcription antitermination factor NusA-like protein
MIPPSKTETIKTIAELKAYFVEVDELNRYNGVTAVRTTKEVATELLLDNVSIIRDAKIRYFQIKHIGLGVYDVKLREIDYVNTSLVENWEKRVINNTQHF